MTARYKIAKERTDNHDHFYDSDYEWRVIDTETGAIVARFEENHSGADVKGTANVEISGDEIVITDHDGTVQRRPLPR